jgi:hypothetical protein
VLELDPYKVGEALMMLAVTSRQLGHKTVRGTIDPYLMSKPREEWSPEHIFVMDLLTKGAEAVVTLDELTTVLRNRAPFDPGAARPGRARLGV